MTTWTAPVRYVEADAQGVVFNAHYLVWCDEALALFCRERGLDGFAERVRLKTSTLTWTAPARWPQRIDVAVSCARVGRTSVTLRFAITADGTACCTVETTYVDVAAGGTPRPIDDEVRAALTG